MKAIDKKVVAIEGVRVGLKAFIITYVIAFVVSLVVNISVIDRIQDYLQGTLSQGIGFNFGLVIKTTSLIMNMAVFNTSGEIQIGILSFVALPLLSFYIADRSDNEKEGMDFIGFIIYGIAGVVYMVLLSLTSFISRGNYLGVNVNFVSLRNMIMTIIIAILIQMVIGMNYDANRLPGVMATRWMIRLSLGITALIAIIAMIVGVLKFTNNVLVILLAILVLMPNLMVYILFMTMGVSVDFNNSLDKLLAFGKLNLSYDAIPIGFRIVLIIIFVAAVIFSLTKVEKSSFIKGLSGFAIVYALSCLLLAYGTRINLGVVKGLMDIGLGINLIQAFVYPFVAIMIMGLLWVAIKHMMKVLKS
jgi:hypothetical protein